VPFESVSGAPLRIVSGKSASRCRDKEIPIVPGFSMLSGVSQSQQTSAPLKFQEIFRLGFAIAVD
jgi:hypothetical protein